MTIQRDSAEFYDSHWESRAGILHDDPVKKQQIDRILEMIPDGVLSVLDVGCGDGAITNQLSRYYATTATDRSRAGFPFLASEVTAVQADAAALPFEDGSFDLVISAEMVEHIPDSTLPTVLGELQRVSARYVLISVPNNEQLRRRFTKCSACNHEFHIYSHFQSFDERRLSALMPGWAPLQTERCGVMERPSINAFRWVMSRVAGVWFTLPESPVVCPNCLSPATPPPQSSLQNLFGKVLGKIERVVLWARGIRAEPDWLMMLFERGNR